MNEKKARNKKIGIYIISLVCIISNLDYYFKPTEMIRVIASWSFCLWIIFASYYWLLKSLYIKKIVLTYILIITETIVGFLLYSQAIINNEIEITFIFLTVLLFFNIRILLSKLIKMETTEYYSFKIEKLKFSENMLSFYIFLSISLIQMMVASLNCIWIGAFILLVFYILFLCVSIKKYIILKRSLSRVIIEDTMVLVEILVSLIFETNSFDFYLFICEFICWLPFLSGFLIESTKESSEQQSE